MAYKSVKSRLQSLSNKTSLNPNVKQQLRNRLEMEMAKETAESSKSSSSNLRRKLPVMAAVVLPLAVIVIGVGYWGSMRLKTSQTTMALTNNTTTASTSTKNTTQTSVPAQPKQTISKYPTLQIDVSSMTSGAGSLSNFLQGTAVHSHTLPGPKGTGASVLTSVDGIGSLVAVNFQGDEYVTAPGYKSTLYFLPAKSSKVQTIAKLNHDGPSLGVVTAAVLSSQWIAWTDFIPNGVLQNVGVYNRATGKSWYVVAPKDEQQLRKKILGTSLFLRGNTLYMYASGTSTNEGSIQSYNVITKKWSTFYTPPANGNLQLLSFAMTGEGAVVELTAGKYNVVLQLNQQGESVGKPYQLPRAVDTQVGVNGNQVIFDGDRDTFAWTPGSSKIQEITNTSGWFSGIGSRYLAGWDYSQQTPAQLLDLQTKMHYDFNANSALVSASKLYWTQGNTLYWAALPK